MSTSFPDLIDGLAADIARLRSAVPGSIRAFSGLAHVTLQAGALDLRTKEPIATAIAVAARCEGCVGYHSKAAIRAGASRGEVVESLRAFDEFTSPERA